MLAFCPPSANPADPYEYVAGAAGAGPLVVVADPPVTQGTQQISNSTWSGHRVSVTRKQRP
jgi:hypothetical protein